MSNKKPLPILVVLLLIAVGAGIAWWHQRQNGETTGDTLVLHGNIDIRQIQLAFNGSERIATMPVREGERVTAGQVLGTLDTQRLQHTVDAASEQVAAQQAVVDRLHAGSRPEEISKARADVEAARANADNARRTADRLATLLGRKLISNEEADNARAAATAAEAQTKAAQEALNLALAGSRKEDIAAGEATLASLQAQLALAQRALADATLRAPADAVVENRILEPGDMASPQTPVYTLALTDPVWARVYVGETDLGKLHPGMRARIETDSYPDKAYAGWVGYISPTAEFTPKSVETREVRTDLVYQVRVYACNPGDELRLGMPTNVTIDLRQPAAEPNAVDPCR